MALGACCGEAKKDFDSARERLGAYLGDKTFDDDTVTAILANSYSVIAEAKLIGHLSSSSGSVAAKRKAIEGELARLTKHAKLYSFKPKNTVHQTVLAEANSIILDA